MAAATIIIIYAVASSPLDKGDPVSLWVIGLIKSVRRKNRNRAAPAEKSAAMGDPLRTRTP
jgi:hypothetical protein